MARLPVPGSDDHVWGNVLNDFLSVGHNTDGSLKGVLSETHLDKQWIVAGPVNVAAGDVDYIAPAYLTVPAGHAAVITAVRARINSGTNVNLRLTQNGSTVSGLNSITATTAGVTVTGLSATVADGDLLAPVVNSTSGGPQNLTFSVTYKITKA